MTSAPMLIDPMRILGLSGQPKPVDIVDWAEQNYYIKETGQPIKLMPHQKAVLRYIFKRDAGGDFPFQTVIWSQPKKSGKTTLSGIPGRWAAETWGRFQNIFCIGNDLNQAKERAFEFIKVSIELNPAYDRHKETLPDQWKLAAESMECLSTGSRIKAIAADYAGEAGSNPAISIYTELWGFVHKDALRFWAEMAPSPVVKNSMRFVETYAGYEGESELLYGLYETAVINGRQLTAGELSEKTGCELGVFAEATKPDDPVPCYVNEAAGMFAYWDEGEKARRMPWQQGESGRKYYASEEATQTPNQFTRLHKNQWVSAESAFVPIEWFDACLSPLPLHPGERTPLVMALDAAVSGDCFGAVVVSRDPLNPQDGVAVRSARKWTPPPGGKIDYDNPRKFVTDFCKQFNVVEICYDPYQLHDFCSKLQKEGVAWCNPFDQGEKRLKSDKGLYDLIRDRKFRHDGNPDLREHFQNANAKQSSQEDTRLRIVKKSESKKIDLCVCCAMSSFECLRLML